MKQEWEAYWDNYHFPELFMQRKGEPFDNPARVMIAKIAEVGNSILDVGCAACISYPLFQDKKEYVGVDFTRRFLQVAKKNFPTVPAVCGTALSLPFKDGAFDSAVIKDVLEHLGIDGYKIVIPEMWRVVKRQILIVATGPLRDQTVYNQGSDPDGIFHCNRYGRKDVIDNLILKLPDLESYELIENIPVEASPEAERSREMIIVKKKE